MTEGDDRLIQAVADLPQVTPDREWAQRVRDRCHSEIARRESSRQRARRQVSFRMRLLDVVAVAALGVYLSVVLRETARLGGLF